MTAADIKNRLFELGYREPEITTIVEEIESYGAHRYESILAQFPAVYDAIPFNGQNCDDAKYNEDDPDCMGWDGYSRRCTCGNRRVSWVFDGDFAYGEAH